MKKKILVIDDEEMIRKFMSDILHHTGYEPLSAADGTIAISILEKTKVDLIMLDMNMPRMDGLEFLRHAGERRLSSAPILMLTGIYDKEKMLECYKLGVYDFIKKPEQLEIMLKRIENGLKIGEMIDFNTFMRMELDAARKLQKFLYPDPELTVDGLSISVYMKLLSDIGGDLYDYVNFQDGRIIFFLADVSGHSIPAALYTAMVKMIFRKAIRDTEDPGDILTMLNAEIAENLPVGSFVTMFCGLLDPKQSRLHYANAGHPRPYLLTSPAPVVLDGHDSFLGPISTATFTTFTADMAEYNGMLLYTDGILDVQGREGPLLNDDRLGKLIGEGGGSPDETFSLLKKFLSANETGLNDDCTVMMIGFK